MLQLSSLQFLEDLKANNNREWFLNNADSYEVYKKNYHQIIREFLNILQPLDESLKDLEVKKCTFRIYRDIRFSKNKTPYKTHMGIWFPMNTLHKNSPGYYVHIEKGNSFIGGGMWNPESEDLKKIRKEIAFFHDELNEIITDRGFKKEFGYFDVQEGSILKTAPKDYEKDHPAIEFLKLKSFTVSHSLSNEEIISPDFISKTAQKLLVLRPLNHFLMRALYDE